MNISIQRACQGPTAEYAERELRHFLSKYSSLRILEGEGGELLFRLEIDSALESHCYQWKRIPGGFLLQGGSASSLLCCVYELLSAMGICFTTEGDFLKPPFSLSAPEDVRRVSPYCRHRGIRQHINFPMDISSYSLREAREYVRRLARMGMNAITFHSYNGQWHPYVKDGKRIPAGHFFYGQRHPLPRDPALAAVIDNRRTFCIPEAEPVIDDAASRARMAVFWLSQVIGTAKEAGMRVSLSLECQEQTPLEVEREMIRSVLEQYPQIDAVELITPEGGGEGRTLTGGEAMDLARELFGPETAEAALRALTREDGRLPFDGKPTSALEGTLRSVKQIWRIWSEREQLLKGFPGKELQVGLYVTCRETLRAAKEVMNRIFPPDLIYTFLPAHGAVAVAENVDYMGFTDGELQRTLLYSWVEFDGNMYLQQNGCGGIQRLLEVCRAASPAPSIYGICFNHWRTAENSLTISYAAEAARNGIPAEDYYLRYAREHAIGRPALFAEQMSALAELDVYNRDNLFNIGFCYLGCWLNPKGLGWIRDWKPESIEHSIAAYERLTEGLSRCLEETVSPEGIGRLRLWVNRCACSSLHLKAIRELSRIALITDDNHPEALSEERKEEIRSLAQKALDGCRAYQRLHIQELPDRGCQGTLASYCETIPVYVDHVLQYFAEGERECTHRPPSLDAPPPPDAAFFQ